jgi:membrane fusion protein, macrolide-specific efflux system
MKARGFRWRSRWLLLPMLLLVGVVWLVRRDGNTARADSTLVVNAKRGSLLIEILATGRVEAREKVELKSKLAGEVMQVLAEEGARVKKGDLLIVLDPTDYEREVARAEADIAQAEATSAFARQTLARTKSSIGASVLAASELDAAQHQYRTSEAALRSARVMLRAAQDRVRYTRLISPIDGTVIQRSIEVGEVVVPGVQATFQGIPLLTVADLSILLIQVDLNQIDVAKVELGQLASLSLDALPGKEFEAKVTRIAPASIRRAGQDVDVFPIEAEIIGSDSAIKPGMTADVRIHLQAQSNVITLPIEAVVKDAAGTRVTRLVTDAKGKESRQQVEVALGARNDRELEIKTGLEEGDRVLLDPASAAANELQL